MKTLYVRIAPKTGPEKFHRCGMAFTRQWGRVEVDAATGSRLEAEQMLEVAEKQPADFEEVPAAETETETDTGKAAGTSGQAPTGKKR